MAGMETPATTEILPVSVRLKEVGTRLKRLHEKSGVPMPDMIRQAIAEFLDKNPTPSHIIDAHMEYRRRLLKDSQQS